MSRDVLTRQPPPADQRIAYGTLSLQFGDLRLPATRPGIRSPVVVFIHGGWWQSEYGLEYGGHLCQALKDAGIATWSLEYRRVGNDGGGWPGTMQDVAQGFDHLSELAKAYPLDINRILCMGHSAGGQLAFWLAGRQHIPAANVLHHPQPKLAISGLVALAGAVDLRLVIKLGGIFRFTEGAPAVRSLLGGGPEQVPDRYAAADPAELLPLGVPQTLIQGSEDEQIPAELPKLWAQEARKQGDAVNLLLLPGAGHFDVVDPQSSVWPQIQAAIVKLLG